MKREFEQQRAKELTDAFLHSWENGVLACEAMRNAALQPCSRFWISSECAYRRLHYKKRPKNVWLRKMLAEIERRLDGRTDLISVEEVVHSPAPQFYMAGDTARKIIQRELRRRKRCRQQQRGY